jgi:HlyD family secretion protein
MADDTRTVERKKRARSALLRRLILSAIGLAFAAVLAWAFLPKPLTVEHGVTTTGRLRTTIEEDGKTRVRDGARYIVSAPLLATFARSQLVVGDEVAVDDVVARLMPMTPPLLDSRTRAEARARIDRAEDAERLARATVKRLREAGTFADRELARLRALRANGAVDERSVDRAENEAAALRHEIAGAELAANVADHELALARAVLELPSQPDAQRAAMLLRSPLRGKVMRLFQQSEAVVQPGAPLVELGDPSALEVVVPLLTSDAVQITPGTPAAILHWGGSRELRAHVRMVEPSATTRLSSLGVEEQRVDVVLALDSPYEEWRALGNGYRVEVSFLVSEGEPRVLAPASAVFRHRDGHAVFRVADGRAALTPVRIGARNADQVEIVSGLAEAAQVIVHPSDRVHDGARVTSRPSTL